MPAKPSSFLDLMGLHAELTEAFLCHQEALLALDVDEALRRLAEYEGKLAPHMQAEEERLLPLYAERAGRISGGPVELFLGEHRKMREFLAGFRAELLRIRGEDLPKARRSAIALMDRQAPPRGRGRGGTAENGVLNETASRWREMKQATLATWW